MTRSNMTSQRTATKRNSQAEQVAHFVITKVADQLIEQNLIQSFSLSMQEQFNSEISRDRWDHALKIEFTSGTRLEIWCQTTCYKGHSTGVTEANKTYEVRETLTEALSIKAVHSSEVNLRTLHFTFGDPDYVYSWFKPMKDMSFDKSLFFDSKGDIFELIEASIGSAKTEKHIHAILDKEISSSTPLGGVMQANVQEIMRWWEQDKCKESVMSVTQAKLVKSGIPSETEFKALMSHATGENIKKKAVDAILSSSHTTENAIVQEVVNDFLIRKPFLKSASEQILDWDEFGTEVSNLIGTEKDKSKQVIKLWNARSQSSRESLRRILLRIHSDETTDYVQDLGIQGITEHNLYGGIHSVSQVEEIASIIVRNCSRVLGETFDLKDRILNHGKSILRNQIYFEVKNGTSSRSSFDFILKAVRTAGYKVVSATDAHIKLIGYHSELTNSNVRAYTNFKIIQDNTGKALCILKGKFFSVKEFDRRCKEEGFVGLSLTYKWDGAEFTKRFDIPIAMCIDMESDFIPPEFSVRKLTAMGWCIAFGPEHLIKMLADWK